MFGKHFYLLFCLAIFFTIDSITVLAQTKTLLQSDFENGTQKWEKRGENVSITSSKDHAKDGSKSLRVSGRRAFWNGAQLNITKTIEAKNTYKFTLSARLAKGESPDQIKMTIQRGDNQFEGLAAATVTGDEWTVVSGKFRTSGGDPYLLVYVEAERANTSFFIDEFKIENLGDEIPAQTGEILKSDFEDMTAQDWFARGENVQMFSSNAFGSQNVKVSGRTQNWHGLQLDVSPILFKGRSYEISVSVRLAKGQAKDTLAVTMQQTPTKGAIEYVNIVPPAMVTDGEWTTLVGRYSATTNDNNLVIYIEAGNSSTSFHIDNFSVRVP